MNKSVWNLLLVFLLAGWASARAEGVLDCSERLQRRPYRQNIRESFTAKYAEKIYASEEQNQRYIDLVLSGAPRAHVVAEFALLKSFNAVLNNKDLVTALTNFHKELVLEEIAKALPNLTFDFYSDFKSIRLALPAGTDPSVYDGLERAFANANRRFYASSVIAQITRGIDRSNPWFCMGIGRTGIEAADRAALAGRFARLDGGVNGVRDYDEPVVRESLTRKLARVKALHAQVVNELRPLRLTDGEGLALEVFAEARKAKTAADLRAGIQNLTGGAEVGESLAARVLEYIRAIDEFSPNMLVAKRELLTIHDAPYGAISIDFIGLGAENIKGTAKALIDARDLDDAVRLARLQEREVTGRFNARKALVERATLEFFGAQASVRFSGDDGIILPPREFLMSDQIEFMRKLSSLLPRPFFRMVVLGAEGAASMNSSELITQAESIEKKLRAGLLERMQLPLLNDSHFQALIWSSGESRKVVLLMGISRRLTVREERTLKLLFPKAVQAVGADVRAQGRNLDYEALDIYSTGGR